MFAYLLRRALTLLPILLLMSIIVFALIRMVPGDPIDVMYGSEGMDEIRRAALVQELGLDQPVTIQYVRWLVRAAQGDLGNSYRAGMPVLQLIVVTTTYFATAIVVEASLSFLGLGIPPPAASWGTMLNDGRKYMESAPHTVIFPGVAISLTVLGFNLLGDGLRDVLDPRLKNLQ